VGINDEQAYPIIFKKGLPCEQPEIYRNTTPTYGLGIATKLPLGPQNVLIQAQRYSAGATVNPRAQAERQPGILQASNSETQRHPPARSAPRRVGKSEKMDWFIQNVRLRKTLTKTGVDGN
jgi:hypothetical protein